ncbi:M23 family metallopeptidase [Altererythrobacter sp. TH136]|uniref:M23 family metallopeptidase n=1 Tax=Altererythrobacter sp. TH136 TaxID=2067415 RepID=UPI0032C12908
MAFASSAAQRVDGRPLASSSLTSRFGMRGHPVSGGVRMHSGVDLAAPAGSPVYATASGVVSFANWNGGYGQLVVVDHGNQIQTRFAHLSRLLVAPGQRVSKGQVVGLVGSTGRSTGPHLHYEIRQAGRAVNPLTR